ncbi:hypothetical protein A7U60_g8314 [Sanghuangporus baumii]|uniref:HMG box domain-containing protein n=1 Tax=Sanghuangporus baumii TaxID=108892 RepID=A0A9Q5HRU8_SANBA|nr:hypothetical protein A7U60_g8314 [Sanghuangporus baumii]
MPTTRSPARSAVTPYHCQSTAEVSPKNSEAQSSSLSTSRATKDDISASVSPESSLNTTVSSRKRRSPNAFILYRPYIIAEKLYPPELTHQNEVSCFVARRWKAAPVSERNRFFRMADDEKRRLKDESPRVEPSKRKRSRSSKKSRTSRIDGPRDQMESSETCTADAKFPMLSLPFDFPTISSSSQTISAPSFDAFPLASLHISHPPPYATSYNLPEWNQELDKHEHDTLQPGHALSHWPSSSSYPSSSSTPYQVDNSYFGALDAAMQVEMDFQLSVEGNTSFAEDLGPELTSYWAEPPPFDVYLPLMPSSYDQ